MTDAPNPSAAKTEPVAWRISRVGEGSCYFWDVDPRLEVPSYADDSAWEVTPLYAHPQPSLSVGLDKEAVKSAIRRHVHGNVVKLEGRSVPGLGINGVDKAADAVLALALAAPAEGWQPIETWKPESADAHWPYLEALIVVNGVVMAGGWKPGNNPPETGEWWPANLDSEYGDVVYPTHWMPLPAAPTGETGA